MVLLFVWPHWTPFWALETPSFLKNDSSVGPRAPSSGAPSSGRMQGWESECWVGFPYRDCFAKFEPNMGEMYLNNTFNSFFLFSLRFGIVKSRFHYFRHRNFTFSWFLDFLNPQKPVFTHLLYQKAQKKTINIVEHPGQNIIFGNMRPKHFENVGTCVYPTFWNCEILEFGNLST